MFRGIRQAETGEAKMDKRAAQEALSEFRFLLFIFSHHRSHLESYITHNGSLYRQARIWPRNALGWLWPLESSRRPSS